MTYNDLKKTAEERAFGETVINLFNEQLTEMIIVFW